MTPKEKAEELVDKIYINGTSEISYKIAKQCALIAVDEIIKTLNPPCLNEFSYWQQVKNEIELL